MAETDKAVAAPSDETMRLIYEHVRGVLREQATVGQQLDSKTLTIVGVGGVVLGFSGTTAIGNSGPWVGAFILAALGAFIALALLGIRQLRPAKYHVSDDAPNVWSLWDLKPTAVMHALIDDIVKGYKLNQEVLEAKAKRLRQSLAALTLEIVLVSAAIALSAFSS